MGPRKGQKQRTLKQRAMIAMQCGQMRIMGYTYLEIGQSLNIPWQTAQWFVNEWERISDNEVKKLAGEQVAKQIIKQSRERSKQFWQIYLKAQKETMPRVENNITIIPKFSSKVEAIKLSALEQIRHEDEVLIKLCQSLGFFPEEPKKLTGELSLVEQLHKAVTEKDADFEARAASIIPRIIAN